MPVYTFRTIQGPAEGQYKEKGSRFLAFAYPVTQESEIKESIEMLKRKYFDARHYCFAWVLGPEKSHFRAFDDGEPGHSAGDPILGQIRSRDLTDVLVVVVRYFGGTKLGVGGLISAYKTAAQEALNQAVIVKREVVAHITLTYAYDATPEAMKLVKEFDLVVVAQQFETQCVLQAAIPLSTKEGFDQKVALLRALGVQLDAEDAP
jgi:uncharacterized YigZ family protein